MTCFLGLVSSPCPRPHFSTTPSQHNRGSPRVMHRSVSLVKMGSLANRPRNSRFQGLAAPGVAASGARPVGDSQHALVSEPY
jgi:hypothetical protein